MKALANIILDNYLDVFFDKNKMATFRDVPREVFINAMIEYGKNLDVNNSKKKKNISKHKPKLNQEIRYICNHGFGKGTYIGSSKGLGWVKLPNGGKDCFDEWI